MPINTPQFRVFDYGSAVGAGQNNAMNRHRLQQARDPNSVPNQMNNVRLQTAQQNLASAQNPNQQQYASRPAANIQIDKYVQELSEMPNGEDRVKAFYKRTRNQNIKKVGGVWNIVAPDGSLIPLSTLKDETGANQALAGATATGRNQSNLEYEPQIAEQIRIKESDVDFNYKPKTAGRVATEQETSKENVKIRVENKKKGKALQAYNVGMGNLRTALSNTLTGPVIGRIGAITAAQQVVDNARAILLPVLKGIVREAGEGVFTDADAEAVMKLIPGRVTDEAAIDQIFSNIDDFMQTKLAPTKLLESIQYQTSSPEQSKERKTINGVTYIKRNGEWYTE